MIPTTPVGLRDRAIILTLTFTGRRRAEVLGMTAGDIAVEGGTVFYTYRGKGGKTGKRELPQPAYEAIQAWLAASGKDLATMRAGRVAVAGHANGRGDHERDVLQEPAALPEEGRAAARRRAHLPALGREAAARRRRVDRGRVALPRPQQPGGDDDLPAAAGGAGGPELGKVAEAIGVDSAGLEPEASARDWVARARNSAPPLTSFSRRLYNRTDS